MNKQRLSVVGVLIVTAVVAGYFYFRAPIIERVDDPNNTPVWTCPGCPRGSSVAYIDRRNPKQIVYYYDGHADGLIRGHGVLNGYYDKCVKVEDSADEAEEWNAKSKAGNWNDGRRWIARDSDEARELQRQYDEVRTAYLKLHPKADLAENKPRVPPVPEPIRAEKVKLFFDLLAEYRAEGTRPHQRGERASETSQYRTMLAFYELGDAYRTLNSTEKRFIFEGSSNLPRGIKLDGGPEVTQILGIPLTGKDAREDFEWFLKLSYMETDYMSAWSIYNDGQMDKIRDTYYRELEAKGLKLVLN